MPPSWRSSRAVTAPGDRIAFEQLTYASISRAANLIGRRTVVFGSDEHGVRCGGFRAALRPAASETRLPDARAAQSDADRSRRRTCCATIAEIARKYNVWLIEDSIYGNLLEKQPVHPRLSGAGADLPCRRTVKGRGGRRACRLGRLPAAFRAARADGPQDGDRRPAVHAGGTCRPARARVAMPRQSAPACGRRSPRARPLRARSLTVSTSRRIAMRRSCG